MNIWILIILIAGNYGANSGASATSIEFNSRVQCKLAQEKILTNNRITRIEAYCIAK